MIWNLIKIGFKYLINCFLKANFIENYRRNCRSFLIIVNVYIMNEKEEKEKLIYIALPSFIRIFFFFLFL